MRKKIILLGWFIALSLSAQAIDKQAIADTLTAIAQQRTYVAPIKISSVRVSNNNITIVTDANLSYVSFSEQEIKHIRQAISKLVLGNENGKVKIYTSLKEGRGRTKQRYEIGDLVTSCHRHRPANARYALSNTTPWVSRIASPYTANSGLEGKHIALYGSHGRFYNATQDRWMWQRAKLWTTVEDVFTSSFVQPFLVPMLENAGAVVIQPRERDMQTYEQVVDEWEAQQTGNETFKTDTAGLGWGHPTSFLLEGDNPFTMGHYAVSSSALSSTSELRYIPTLPDGEYAVYVSYKSLKNSTNKAHYTVVHKGQRTQFSVNQRMGGGTWCYLGTFSFGENPDENYVALSNEDGLGQVITADAVKFGGGMGSVARYPLPLLKTKSAEPLVDSTQLLINQQYAQVSGMSRYAEGARYWMQYSGIPDSIYNVKGSTDDYTDDYASRGAWANYLAGGSEVNPAQDGLHIPIQTYLAFHTDAGSTKGGDTIIGTLLIYYDHDNDMQTTYPTGQSRILARDLGDFVQTQIINDIRPIAPSWMRRQLKNSSYAETRIPKMPAIILELLSHQNINDMRYALDPRIKFTVSRAIYKGILRFIHEQYGTNYVVQPLPVQQMRIQRTGNQLDISWSATTDTLEPTAKPTYYVVYVRTDDGDWDNGTRVNKPHYTLTAQTGTRYAVRVAAGNSGGISLPSETLAAYIAPEEKGNVLIVNGFTRLSGPEWFRDSTYMGITPFSYAVPYGKDFSYIGDQYDYDSNHPWRSDDDSGLGMCFSNHQATITAGNTFDYVCLHGDALAQEGYSYVSSSVAALDTIRNCDMVDLILGKQKTTILGNDTAFKCFPAPLQDVLTRYLNNGGRLLLSGSYIATDICSTDTPFIHKQLHYKSRGTHASQTGQVRIIRELPAATLNYRTTPNAERIHTENPDGLSALGDNAICIARYEDTGVGAAIAYNGDNGTKTLCWSFMLESAYDFNSIYLHCINWLMR